VTKKVEKNFRKLEVMAGEGVCKSRDARNLTFLDNSIMGGGVFRVLVCSRDLTSDQRVNLKCVFT